MKSGKGIGLCTLFVFCLYYICILSVSALEDQVTLYADNVTTERVSLSVQLVAGYSMFVDPVSVDSRLNFSYPGVVNFSGENETVNFSVRINGTFVENASINNTFLLSNDYNANTFNFTIQADIVVLPTIFDNEGIFISSNQGNCEINTSIVPVSDVCHYEVAGLAGELLNISCDGGGWIACPGSQTFDGNNLTMFDVTVDVPAGTSIGTYVYGINLSTGNVSLQRNVTVRVKEPDILFKQFVLRPECFVDAGGEKLITEVCALEMIAFNQQQIAEAIRRINEKGQNICDVENYTEYVRVQDIEAQVVNDLDSCRSSLSELEGTILKKNDVISDKDSRISSLQGDINRCERVLANNETACLESVFSTSVRLKQNATREVELAQERERAMVFWTWFSVFSIIICGVLAAVIRNYLRARREELFYG